MNLSKMQRDPAAFRTVLCVDTDAGPRRLAEVVDDWQLRDFKALDAGWRYAAHRERGAETISEAYLERPRGHSKTTDLAIMVAWILFASRYQLAGNAAAADKDQARLLRDAVQRLVILNKWLGKYLDVQRYRIVNHYTESELRILTSDGETTMGENPDFIVADELTHWVGVKGEKLWEALYSAAGKRRHCMLVIISNAGLGRGSSWQWRVREDFRLDPRSYFSCLVGPQASWQDRKRLEKQRRRLSTAAFRRLWLNQWTRGEGDALEASDIEAAMTQKGPMTAEEAKRRPWVFFGGLDLGVKHDHSALVVWASVPGGGRVRLAECRSWKPQHNDMVDLMAVERAVRETDARYGLCGCAFDPSQAFLMAQRLAKSGLHMLEVSFQVGKNLDLMARELLRGFRGRSLDLYRDDDLIRDLHRLTILEKRYGFKLEAVSDEHGHADRAIAGVIALPLAMEVADADFSLEASGEIAPQRLTT
jgi:hypothetical protein